MRHPLVTLALVTLATLALPAATPVSAADPLPWPWKAKTPPDLALVVLPSVKAVTVKLDNSIVSMTVEVEAPTPNYSELQLTPRIGDPKDRIFAFDARGRAPQEVAAEVITPVTIEAAYADAPIGKFDVVEVYAKANCVGYSVKEAKPVECKSKPEP
jgi:hypothetical protein